MTSKTTTALDVDGNEIAIPTKIRKQIEGLMINQSRAKSLEAEAKIIKAGAKKDLTPIMAAFGIKSYEVAGFGKSGLKVNRGSSINKTKLKEALLLESIPIVVIERVIESATKSWSSEYVDFVAAK